MVENDYYKDIISALQKIESSDDRDTIRKVTKIWRHEYQKHIGIGKRVFIVGNGGSCAIAEHISTDLNKRCNVKALTLSNNSLLTALTNDYTQEHALVEWMKMNNFGKTDFLVGISSSGLSKNILFALEHASDCLALTFSIFGMKGLEPFSSTCLSLFTITTNLLPSSDAALI